MKLQEYRSKEILARHGMPLLAGEVATTPEEARAAAERIGGPVVVKAQVLVGGRGKAGGVKLAATPDEAEQRAREIIGLDIKGVTVKTVLLAPAADIAKEFYLGLILDRGAKAVTVIARPAPLTMQPMVPSSLMKLMPACRAAISDGSSSLRSRITSRSGWR